MSAFDFVSRQGARFIQHHQESIETFEWEVFRQIETGTYRTLTVFDTVGGVAESVIHGLAVPLLEKVQYATRYVIGAYRTKSELSR